MADERKKINDKQAELMAKRRAAERNIELPACVSPARRRICLEDPALFLQWYFGDPWFRNPFTSDQLEIIDEIHKRMRYGGKRAIAAARGDGKSTITSGMAIYGACTGLMSFGLLIGANDTKAVQLLRNVKAMLTKSDRFAQDFPLPYLVGNRLKRAPNAANGTLVNGESVDCQWGANQIVLPINENDLSKQLVFVATGWQSGDIRGQLHEGKRPDFILLDDLDTRKAAKSKDITEEIEKTIEEDVAGLAGPGESMAAVLLCTRINRRCSAYRYTSPHLKPAWAGKVYKLIPKLPDWMEGWHRYIDMRVTQMQSGTDPDAREAFRFVRDNFAALHAGHECSNPHRAIRTLHEDGEPMELSTLHHFMNRIADAQCKGVDGEPVDGWQFVLTEYNNDPPGDEDERETGATEQVVADAVNGIARRVVPRGTQYLTAHFDIHKRHITWTVKAWTVQNGLATGRTIDYGDPGTIEPEVLGAEESIFRTLCELKDSFDREPYLDEDDEPVHFDLCLVDCGYQFTSKKQQGPDYAPTIHRFLKFAGRPWMGARGVASFKMPDRGAKGRKPGKGGPWYKCKMDSGLWEIHFDPNFFKHVVHERFQMPSDQDGAFTLYGNDPFEHKRSGYARQVSAQVYTEQWVNGTLKKGWRHRPGCREDHYGDTEVGATVAACVAGLTFADTGGTRKKTERRQPVKQAAESPQQRPLSVMKSLVGPPTRPKLRPY